MSGNIRDSVSVGGTPPWSMNETALLSSSFLTMAISTYPYPLPPHHQLRPQTITSPLLKHLQISYQNAKCQHRLPRVMSPGQPATIYPKSAFHLDGCTSPPTDNTMEYPCLPASPATAVRLSHSRRSQTQVCHHETLEKTTRTAQAYAKEATSGCT